MAAKEGNKYAEVWTEDKALETVNSVLEIAKREECIYLGSALVELGLYKDIWGYFKEKFADNKEVLRTIKAVDQIFEKKLFVGGLSGVHNPTMAIFGLKNNHGWVDKMETNNTTDLNINWQETKTYDGAD